MTTEGARHAKEELDLTRRLVVGDISMEQFIAPFMGARHAEIGAGSSGDLVLSDFLDDIWYAIDMYNEDEELREPNGFDDEQLIDVLAGYLAAWDAGTWQFDPRWARE
jgi:Bacterial self-protective colicin-like immunity